MQSIQDYNLMDQVLAVVKFPPQVILEEDQFYKKNSWIIALALFLTLLKESLMCKNIDIPCNQSNYLALVDFLGYRS